MRTKFYVETTRDGLQFIRLKRANLNHRSPCDLWDERLCRRHTNCMHASVKEWNDLVHLEQIYQGESQVLNRSLDRQKVEKAALQRTVENLRHDMSCMAASVGETVRARNMWQEKFKLAQEVIDEKADIIKNLKDQLALSSRLLARHNIAC